MTLAFFIVVAVAFSPLVLMGVMSMLLVAKVADERISDLSAWRNGRLTAGSASSDALAETKRVIPDVIAASEQAAQSIAGSSPAVLTNVPSMGDVRGPYGAQAREGVRRDFRLKCPVVSHESGPEKSMEAAIREYQLLEMQEATLWVCPGKLNTEAIRMIRRRKQAIAIEIW